MLNDWFGCALRGGSGLGVDFADTDACALRLLDRLDPSLFSSGNPRKFVCTADAEADAGVAMGEYSRPCDVLEDDGSEETCSRIANSVVAFVSCTIFARKVPDRAWGPPYILIMLDSCTTVFKKTCASSRSAFLSGVESPSCTITINSTSRFVTPLARSKLSRTSAFSFSTSANKSSIVSHTPGAISTASFTACTASLSTWFFADDGRSKNDVFSAATGDEDPDRDDACVEVCEVCLECARPDSNAYGDGGKGLLSEGVLPFCGVEGACRLPLGTGVRDPLGSGGDSTSIEGIFFPSSTSLKLKDPA